MSGASASSGSGSGSGNTAAAAEDSRLPPIPFAAWDNGDDNDDNDTAVQLAGPDVSGIDDAELLAPTLWGASTASASATAQKEDAIALDHLIVEGPVSYKQSSPSEFPNTTDPIRCITVREPSASTPQKQLGSALYLIHPHTLLTRLAPSLERLEVGPHQSPSTTLLEWAALVRISPKLRELYLESHEADLAAAFLPILNAAGARARVKDGPSDSKASAAASAAALDEVTAIVPDVLPRSAHAHQVELLPAHARSLNQLANLLPGLKRLTYWSPIGWSLVQPDQAKRASSKKEFWLSTSGLVNQFSPSELRVGPIPWSVLSRVVDAILSDVVRSVQLMRLVVWVMDDEEAATVAAILQYPPSHKHEAFAELVRRLNALPNTVAPLLYLPGVRPRDVLPPPSSSAVIARSSSSSATAPPRSGNVHVYLDMQADAQRSRAPASTAAVLEAMTDLATAQKWFNPSAALAVSDEFFPRPVARLLRA